MIFPGMEVMPPIIPLAFYAFAIWATVGYYVRSVLRDAISTYDQVNELYHPAMQVAMAYMFLPLGHQVIPYGVIAVVFVFAGLYFVFRIVYAEYIQKRVSIKLLAFAVAQYKKLSYDRSHALLGFGTAYMFAPVRHILIVDTLFTVFYLWIAMKYVRELVLDLRNGIAIPEARLAALISDFFHIVMGGSMAYMNVMMFVIR